MICVKHPVAIRGLLAMGKPTVVCGFLMELPTLQTAGSGGNPAGNPAVQWPVVVSIYTQLEDIW